MAEFNLYAFSSSLIDLFTNSTLFPYSQDPYMTKNWKVQDIKEKHKGREPLHLKDAVIKSIANSHTFGENMQTFDIGSEQMEVMHPYFHILQDSPYIRKRGMGSAKTRGIQAKVEPAKRDYNKISWNGKTYSREYARNVRGSRNRQWQVSRWVGMTYINRESKEYLNVHYKYIDNILDSIVSELASSYGLRVMRKKDSGLEEDYNASAIVDSINSFEGE